MTYLGPRIIGNFKPEKLKDDPAYLAPSTALLPLRTIRPERSPPLPRPARRWRTHLHPSARRSPQVTRPRRNPTVHPLPLDISQPPL